MTGLESYFPLRPFKEGSSKHQIPDSQQFPITKTQKTKNFQLERFWGFEFGIYLEFEYWDLEFTSQV